jgi:hypothetical protein
MNMTFSLASIGHVTHVFDTRRSLRISAMLRQRL